MEDQMLYIDGALMDIDLDTRVTLQYRSNVLQDVSRIAANHTYTFRLPKTVRNINAISHADGLGKGERYPYMTHRAEYFRNGVRLIAGGRAVLLGVSDRIEIAITWGVPAGVAKMAGEGLSIRGLGGGYSLEYGEHNSAALWSEFIKSPSSLPYFYARIRYFKENEDEGLADFERQHGILYYNLRPVARVSWLLGLAAKRYGVTFSFPPDAEEIVNRLIIPCTGITATQDSALVSSMTVTNLGRSLDLLLTTDDNGRIFDPVSGETRFLSVSADKDVFLTVECAWEVSKRDMWQYYMLGFTIGIGVDDGSGLKFDDENIFAGDHVDELAETVRVTVKRRVEMSLAARERIAFKLYPKKVEKGMFLDFYCLKFVKSVSVKAELPAGHDVQYGQKYPILENLPDIKVMDLLKYVATITGTFPVNLGDGTLMRFASYDDVLSKVGGGSVDWTDRLLPTGMDGKAGDLRFAMSGWARRNIYKYKEDKENRESHDGTLEVFDGTLPAERKAAEFPFASSDSIGGLAVIPIYSCSNTREVADGNAAGTEIEPKYTMKKVEPRILLADGERFWQGTQAARKVIGTFRGLGLQGVIDTRLTFLKMIARNARIVKDLFRISDIELTNFDETTPVYLSQRGAYFAVLEIRSASAGVAEVTMIEINF